MNYLQLVLLIVSNLVVAIYAQHCIQYEFHEKAVHQPRKSEIIAASCEKKDGRILKYTSVIMNSVGPPIFNVTFHCCQNKACFTDLDCSFNFQCKAGKCVVANCDLSDSLDTVSRENDECIINDDCYFTIPHDLKNWGCIRDAGCGVYKNCTKGARFCKRCPTGYYKDVPKTYVSTTTTIKPIAVTTVSTTTTTTARPVSTERVTKPSTVASTTSMTTPSTTTVITENVTESEAVTATGVRNDSTVTDDLFNVTTDDENFINATTANIDLNVTSVTSNYTTVMPVLLNSDAISGNNSLYAEDEDYNVLSNSNNAFNNNNTLVFEYRNETRNEIN